LSVTIFVSDFINYLAAK